MAQVSSVAPFFTLVALASFGVSFLYHVFLSKKTLWLSPGEQLAGRVIRSGEKQWVNPYGCNRWALFLVILVTISTAGNAWNWMLGGTIPSFHRTFGTVIQITLLSLGAVWMGKGRLWGAWFPFVLFGLGAVIPTWDSDLETISNPAKTVFGLIAAVNGLVAVAYSFLRQ